MMVSWHEMTVLRLDTTISCLNTTFFWGGHRHFQSVLLNYCLLTTSLLIVEFTELLFIIPSQAVGKHLDAY